MSAVPRLYLVLLFAVFGCGCAATPGRTHGEDPWESWNRGVYKFNDVVDRATLKPIAKGYKKITPHWMRRGIANFFGNLETPATILNEVLQGKGKAALRDTGRFLLNSTVGVAGLFDVGTSVGLEANDEDFGQTLAVWGVGSGPYLTLPFFGPTTLRDAPARVFDFFLDPLDYADLSWQATWGKRALRAVQSRAELLPLEPTLQRTYDPYAFVRDAWVQQREFQIFDGNPPPETLEEEFQEDDADAPPETTDEDH
ncbi:MAG TPA: VacJ family lipoprotein [Steroidobacter sp.]|nr:VacJ family lipoprotein [Steroidobacter sp.]